MKIDLFFSSAYTQNYNSLKFKIFVTEFKNHYKTNLCSKQLFSSQTSFAATLQKQTQFSQKEKFISKSFSNHINKSSKNYNQENSECFNSCDQYFLWSKCYYLNSVIWFVNVNKNIQVQKKIDIFIVASSQMTASIKLIQDQFKKKKNQKINMLLHSLIFYFHLLHQLQLFRTHHWIFEVWMFIWLLTLLILS